MNHASEPAVTSAPRVDPLTALPVAVIGAGPVGLAAAAHLVQRGLVPLVLEQGAAPAQAMREWAHVRVFSPWRYNVDLAASALLAETGWVPPAADALPTGGEIVATYLEPLARHPQIAPHLRMGARVVGITRQGFAKTQTAGRELAPFSIRWCDDTGTEHEVLAQAVIDASGTWFQPNPLGASGQYVPGERELSGRIAYGLPNVLGPERIRYAGKRVLVVGAGHSAVNVVLDLLRLQASAPATEIHWALRTRQMERLFGGGASDQLPARGALGTAVKQLLEKEQVRLLAPFAATRVTPQGDGVRVTGTVSGEAVTVDVDRIIVATGSRPDVDLTRELRVALDPILEAPPALAPLIDPNVHSCGTVPPHGVAELAHPEPGFYIVGSKSYGRAPTFLMATGYEQVRSVVAEIAGDHEAARQVHLVLPETGVCGTGAPQGSASESACCGLVAEPVAAASATAAPSAKVQAGCCGGPAAKEVDACCADDATAKAQGKSGCGCG